MRTCLPRGGIFCLAQAPQCVHDHAAGPRAVRVGFSVASGCLVGTSLEPLPRPVCRWEAGWEARRHAAPSASVGAPPRAQRAVRPRPPTSKALQFCGVLGGSHPSWRRASLRGGRMGFSYFSFAILMTASFAWRCGTDLPSRLPELSHGLWVLSLGLPALPPHFGRLALLPPSPARQGPGLHGNGDALPGTHPTSSGAPDGRTSRLRGGEGPHSVTAKLSHPPQGQPRPPGLQGAAKEGAQPGYRCKRLAGCGSG